MSCECLCLVNIYALDINIIEYFYIGNLFLNDKFYLKCKLYLSHENYLLLKQLNVKNVFQVSKHFCLIL